MRAGPLMPSISSREAATTTCPFGGLIDSRPCVETILACAPRSSTAEARLRRTASGRSSPFPSVKPSPFPAEAPEEAGEIA